MEIRSTFKNNDKIPEKYTCDGNDISPVIEIISAPLEAKSFVLIVDDPDAPTGDWVHWIVYDISSAVNMIEEGSVPKGAKLGLNDFKQTSYGGPCPPDGTHRYFFKLYALNVEKIGLETGATKKQIEDKIQGHVVAFAQIMAYYSRKEIG